MTAQVIKISGARQHNLKNLHVEIRREKLLVITGLSGSGKSSLAFDTLYAEGQRRYVENVSAYARQFLDRLESQTWISFKDFRPPSPSSSAALARGGSTRLTVTVSTAIGSTVQGWVNLDGEGDNDLHFAYYAHVGP